MVSSALLRDMALRHLPWALLKSKFQRIRQQFFSREPSNHAFVFVDARVDEVERVLASHHFSTWNKLAYHYEGEDLNMRRMEGISYDDDGEKTYWQTHVRAFSFEGGVSMLKFHREKCPVEHPRDHLDMVGFDQMDGYKALEELFTEAGYELFGHSWHSERERTPEQDYDPAPG